MAKIIYAVSLEYVNRPKIVVQLEKAGVDYELDSTTLTKEISSLMAEALRDATTGTGVGYCQLGDQLIALGISDIPHVSVTVLSRMQEYPAEQPLSQTPPPVKSSGKK